MHYPTDNATLNGTEYGFDFVSTHNGWRLTVWKWDTATRDLVKVTESLYPLYTQFEILCTVASELGGETVDGEDLAVQLGIPLRGSDDVKCEKCDTWDHYESEDMVHGTDMLPDVSDGLAVGYWDYVCMACYLDALAKYQVDEHA